MLRFFRHIRKAIMKQQNVRTYLFYALGEILLVMVGILLALQVNNWNEERKNKATEHTILREIDTALSSDSTIIADYFEPRMDRKEESVQRIMEVIESGESISAEELEELYRGLTMKFTYRFNSGPYEALKSKGLEIIGNDSLRFLLINTYEVRLPAYKIFIEYVQDENLRIRNDLEIQFTQNKVVRNSEGELEIREFTDSDPMLLHPAFLKVLKNNMDEAVNSRNRINSIKRIRTSLHKMVREELNKGRG